MAVGARDPVPGITRHADHTVGTGVSRVSGERHGVIPAADEARIRRRGHFISPRVAASLDTARGFSPLGLSGQLLTERLAVGQRDYPTGFNNGMVYKPFVCSPNTLNAMYASIVIVPVEIAAPVAIRSTVALENIANSGFVTCRRKI